jgi:hypothetical protein
MREAFLPDPAIKFAFQQIIDRGDAPAYLAAFFRPGFADIAPFFLDDILRTDGRARSGLAASAANGGYRDEVAVVSDLKIPLAVLHGADEQLVNGRYFASLLMPTLWRGAVRCRQFPAQVTRRNGRRRKPSTRSSRRSWPRRRDAARAASRQLDASRPAGSAHFAIGPYLPALHMLMS